MKFEKLVEDILQETSVIGGAASVMGSNVSNTATAFSGDNYAPGDARIAKSIYGGVVTRNGMKSYGKKKKKKK
jgi:hypothetical protein